MSATPEALVREASSLARQGRAAEAIAVYRQLLDLFPTMPNSWYNLAVQQRKVGEFLPALASYQQALDHGVSRPEEVHLNRSVIYADHLRRSDAAERELLDALALNPTYIPALLNLGNLYEDLGRRESASSTYERALAIDPSNFAALARYANLKDAAQPNGTVIERLQRVLADPAVAAAARAELGFALGRLLDGAGAYAAAFDAYAAANRHSRISAASGLGIYNRALEERFIEQIIAAFPGAAGLAGPRRSSPRPIFVCGMFRSGSTLIEQLLARHPRVRAAGELDFWPRAAQQTLAPFPESMLSVSSLTLENLATRYLDMLTEMFPEADFVTDKRPDNFVFIGLIKMLFPDAKIVHTTRDPLDNCLSIFFLHLDHRMSYALDLLDTGHHYRQYMRLMTHWKTLYGPDIVEVNYDSFVREPTSIAQQLLASLGLDWDDRCLAPPARDEMVKTASVWQVREPIYQRSSGRAQHYETQLAELRHYLTRAG